MTVYIVCKQKCQVYPEANIFLYIGKCAFLFLKKMQYCLGL